MELAAVNPTFRLSNDIWNQLPDILSVLKIFTEKTDFLQKENLTVSCAFSVWHDIKARIKKKKDSPLARVALQTLDVREKMFVENDVVYAGVFLDPRFRLLLSENEKAKAIDHLLYLHQKQTYKLNVPGSIEIPEETLTSSPQSIVTEELDAFEEYLQQIEVSKHNEAPRVRANLPNDAQYVRDTIKAIDDGTRLTSADCPDVWKYWYNKRLECPLLYNLARTVLAVAPTEVSVERNFSTLDFILTKKRTSLLDENLEMILFLKLNKSLFKDSDCIGELLFD